ncbi:hypothetical protein [Janibacter melonis]|uniref:hypothetical protein n=1 Tax=Janibacter melonis TaxID=262209 RepID=UPI0018DB7B86|nr:hypothetical protein [Janibacter melonis]
MASSGSVSVGAFDDDALLVLLDSVADAPVAAGSGFESCAHPARTSPAQASAVSATA